jgi:MoaA/NifB/PqqE/SkfB family radical SAM enzyme
MFSDQSIANLQASLESGRPAAGPTDVQILPTPRCNAACAFCPLQDKTEPVAAELRRFSLYRSDLSGGLLDRLADDLYHLGGLKRLTLTGGEPLLYTFLIPAVFQFARTFSEAELTVVTNGIKLGNYAAFLVHAGVRNLNVSVNAGTPESYRLQNPAAAPDELERIEAGIAAVIAARKKSGKGSPKVTLTAVLTRASAGEVNALFELGRRTGADAVTFLPLMEIRLPDRAVNCKLKVTPEQFQRFQDDIARCGELAREAGFYLGYGREFQESGVITSGDLYRRQPCYLGHTFAAIYPNGDVRPCCHCEPIMGNLTRHSFAEIWNSDPYARQRQLMQSIQTTGPLDGCLCAECGHCYENREYHRRLKGGDGGF